MHKLNARINLLMKRPERRRGGNGGTARRAIEDERSSDEGCGRSPNGVKVRNEEEGTRGNRRVRPRSGGVKRTPRTRRSEERSSDEVLGTKLRRRSKQLRRSSRGASEGLAPS